MANAQKYCCEAARRRLPAPLFHYIDGGADDEWTMHRNTAAFDEVRRRLPAPLFHYIDGGADDEWTMHRNTAAFDEVRLIPNGQCTEILLHLTRFVLFPMALKIFRIWI